MQDLERSIKDLEQARNEISQLEAARDELHTSAADHKRRMEAAYHELQQVGQAGRSGWAAVLQLHTLEARCCSNKLLPHATLSLSCGFLEVLWPWLTPRCAGPALFVWAMCVG